MNFQISALSENQFFHLYGATEDQLNEIGARRVFADSDPGFPCRVSLRDAKIGETLILINHTHHDEQSPYRASHAIFVIEGAEEEILPQNEVPKLLRSRVLSVRGFDQNNDMIDAEVCAGTDLEHAITRLGSNSSVKYLHVHNAGPGCYAARVELLGGE